MPVINARLAMSFGILPCKMRHSPDADRPERPPPRGAARNFRPHLFAHAAHPRPRHQLALLDAGGSNPGLVDRAWTVQRAAARRPADARRRVHDRTGVLLAAVG